MTVGILYVDVVGLCGSWRWLSVACLLFALVWAVAVLMLPETPVFQMRRGRLDDARKALEVA